MGNRTGGNRTLLVLIGSTRFSSYRAFICNLEYLGKTRLLQQLGTINTETMRPCNSGLTCGQLRLAAITCAHNATNVLASLIDIDRVTRGHTMSVQYECATL